MNTKGKRQIQYGVERLKHDHLPRHQHNHAYATVVLAGAFEQTAYCGRFHVQAGDIVIQPTLDCHGYRGLCSGVAIIRLPWKFDAGMGGVYRGCDVDGVHRLAQSDCVAAASLLAQEVAGGTPVGPLEEYGADRFVADVICDPSLKISNWACRNGMSRESFSRSFRHIYDEAPVRFRSEVRARAAWFNCITSSESLASLAAAEGFTDQAHMTHSVRILTGRTPAQWRRECLSGADYLDY